MTAPVCLSESLTAKVWPHAVIPNPDLVFVGDGVVIDDFVLIVARKPIILADGVHIGCGSSILGGEAVRIGEGTSLSAGVRIFTATEDLDGLFGPSAPDSCRIALRAPVEIGAHVLIGANSVVLPGARIGRGAVVGALSMVPTWAKLDEWTVYGGVPVRELRPRNRQPVGLAMHIMQEEGLLWEYQR